VPAALPCLHPGRSARLEKAGKPIGWLGELHPRLQQELSLTAAPLLFELDLDALLDAELPHYREISRFPAVRRDLALVVAEGVAMETLLSHVKVAARGFLQSVTVFDIYRGQGVKKGFKSVALALVLQDTSRTLTDDDVESTVSTVIERLKQQAGAELRE
jgi:phenylalanyl-tRNA synthetase beta chain